MANHIAHRTGVSGRYRAVVHKGHVYDESGEFSGYKEIVQETPFGKNLLTTLFFTDMLAGNNFILGTIVAGAGNVAPSESDSNLTSYLGKCTTCVVHSRQVGDVPGVDGMLFLRTTFRATFNPGSLGASGSVNVAEGGVSKGDRSAVNGTTQLYSHGLLVDDGGVPTTVSVQVASEYLDLYWEYTRYFKMEDSGTVDISIDGVPVTHTWVMRPMNWQLRGSTSSSAWKVDEVVGNTINFYPTFKCGINSDNHNTASCGLRAGPIGTVEQFPSGAINPASSVAIQPFVSAKQREWKITFTTVAGNVAGGAGVLQIAPGYYAGCWQISYSPKFEKNSNKQLDLFVTGYMDNVL